jgi:hypothetical protein
MIDGFAHAIFSLLSCMPFRAGRSGQQIFRARFNLKKITSRLDPAAPFRAYS